LPECVPIGYTVLALRAPRAKTAYIDGELCALRADGVPSFGLLQAAMDQGRTNSLVFFAFDLLYLDGKSTAALPLIERKQRLHPLFALAVPGLHFTDHVVGNGPGRPQACLRDGSRGRHLETGRAALVPAEYYIRQYS
jgi:bifunctional non-homologous end joining protein LigD